MSETVTKKLNNFSGYTSIHGVGRIGDVKYWFLKTFWSLAFMASLGMCIYQVYRLGILYMSQPVNTQVKTENGILPVPGISVCNLNPIKYSSVKQIPDLFQIIEKTAESWSIDLSQFEDNGIFVNPNYTYSKQFDDYSGDPLVFGKKIFKLRMGEIGNLKAVSQTFTEFMISKIFLGRELSEDNFTVIRDEEYGLCYRLNLHEEFQMAEVAGSAFGLELVLNVQEVEYVPFVTESAGVRVAIHDPDSNPIFSAGVSLPTGFESNVGITVVDNIRLPGLSNKCDTTNSYSNIQSCIDVCIGYEISSICGCAHQFQYLNNQSNRMCGSQKDLDCMDGVMLFQVPSACSACKVPCKTDCLLLRIYFSSLTKETIQEELAYTGENFVSDIGGQLGLWVGISVLSLIEVIELIVYVFTAAFSGKIKDRKVDDVIHETFKD